jgi:hypothetical protein
MSLETNSPALSRFGRRSVLKITGLGGLSLALSSTPASAFWFSSPQAEIDLSQLPSGWVRQHQRVLRPYADFLAGLRLKRITPMQVIEAHAKRRGSVWNVLPPKSMWRNMGPTLKVVDRVAAELDQPVREIVSAYRCPSYNRRCRGAKRGSWHQANVAVDVKFQSKPSTVAAVARQLRSRGKFRGGVGRYYSFTHIDTRGRNADW